MDHLTRAVVALVFLSPLLLLAQWCYRRPQNTANRIWLRYIGYYLFVAYGALAVPFVLPLLWVPLPSQEAARTLGRAVGLYLWLWTLISWRLSRTRFRKLRQRHARGSDALN